MTLPARHDGGDTEEIDALLVPVDPVADGQRAQGLPEVSPPRPIAAAARPGRPLPDLRSAPALQAAAVAAGGFLAGAAVVGLARRRRSAPVLAGRRARRSGGRSSGRASRSDLMQVVASRSFLVDVHLLGPSGRGR